MTKKTADQMSDGMTIFVGLLCGGCSGVGGAAKGLHLSVAAAISLLGPFLSPSVNGGVAAFEKWSGATTAAATASAVAAFTAVGQRQRGGSQLRLYPAAGEACLCLQWLQYSRCIANDTGRLLNIRQLQLLSRGNRGRG